MTVLLASCALLAAAASAPPPPAEPAPLPPESVVLALREARIARTTGNWSAERKVLDDLVAAHPDDPSAVAGALELIRRDEPQSERAHALRGKLLDILAKPGVAVPLSLLRELARDPLTTPEELDRLVDVLRAEPAATPDLAERRRLLAALLERLHRDGEMIEALEKLAEVDPDPYLKWRLIGTYRDHGRWDDVLRLAGEIRTKDAEVDLAWARMEAFGALGRIEDLEREATAQIARLLASDDARTALPPGPAVASPAPAPAPGLPGAVRKLSASLAAAFYPTVFRLIDAGRRDAAEGILQKLDTATGGAPDVARMKVMLFGTTAERIASLEAEERATLASGDAIAIRRQADERLVAKDYAAAFDLFSQLVATRPDGFADDLPGWFNYGLAAVQTEHWKEAEEAMTRALALDPKMSRALAHRARAKIMLKRYDEGIQDAKAALDLEPDSKQAAYAMYLAYQMLGDTDDAAKWLKRSGAH